MLRAAEGVPGRLRDMRARHASVEVDCSSSPPHAERPEVREGPTGRADGRIVVLAASDWKVRALQGRRDVPEKPSPDHREAMRRDPYGVQAMGERLHGRRPRCSSRLRGGR